MKKTPAILVFAILFLFFIQLSGVLVESIYILDLMNTNLDEKALGVLFFFSPLVLIPVLRQRWVATVCFFLLLIARGALPYLETANRMLASGVGVFAVLGLLLFLLAERFKGEAPARTALLGSAGLALGLSLSVMLRTLYHGLDYSLVAAGGWMGVALGALLGLGLALPGRPDRPANTGEPISGGVTGALLGVYMVLALGWFSFSAPAVIARWTEGSYPLIVICTSLFSTGWAGVLLLRPAWADKIGRGALLAWNLLFTASLTSLLLAHRVPFPPSLESAPVVVGAPGWIAQALLLFTLVLFPVIFLDMRLFLNRIAAAAPAPRQFVPGILLGGFILLVLIFANIFSNVWGYVEPVSPLFRNTFWLAYAVMAGLIPLLAWRSPQPAAASGMTGGTTYQRSWVVLLVVISAATVVWALPGAQVQVDAANQTSLVVMTFNTQQSNNDFGEKSFDAQLALIQKVAPDVLALQESDSTRISLNNNDYVRYFTEKLGYHAYYGPTTGTGTFGTALLSRFPLKNTRTVFIYSDKDETAVTEAEIEVGGRTFTIYNVHPDSSDPAMLVFAQTLVDRAGKNPYIIALGDYNLRDYEEAYQLVDSVYQNAWTSVYPDKIGPNGLDMSGKNRIDHIFISPSLGVRNPMYILPPESATDHPVHWAEIFWQTP